jgi:hypothetical protein
LRILDPVIQYTMPNQSNGHSPHRIAGVIATCSTRSPVQREVGATRSGESMIHLPRERPQL